MVAVLKSQPLSHTPCPRGSLGSSPLRENAAALKHLVSLGSVTCYLH